MRRFVVSVLLLLSSTSFIEAQVGDTKLQTRSCPGITPSACLVGVYLSGCTEEPCIFTRGGNVSLEVDIEFTQPAENLEVFLYASISGVEIAWPDLNKNACDYIVSDESQGKCPIKSGNYLTYGVTLPVSAKYPQVKPNVRFLLRDENKNPLVCWIVKVHVE